MDINARPLKLVRKDLTKVNDAIRFTLDFIAQYPDDPSLKLGLHSLEYKQKLLFEELERSNNRYMRSAFDFVFDGDAVSNSSVSLACLGDTLSSFQDVITSIVHKALGGCETSKGPIPNEIKKMAQLNVLSTTIGSFRVIITSDVALDEAPSMDALNKFNQLINCADNIKEIKEIRKIVGIRTISKYQKFIYTLVKHDIDMKLYDKVGTDRFTTREITKELANRIYKAVDKVEELPEQKESFKGKLKGVDIHTNYFRFSIDEETQITGKYDSLLRDKLMNPDFREEVTAVFMHKTKYNDALDEETEDWELIGIEKE